jgi:hypothetical protein
MFALFAQVEKCLPFFETQSELIREVSQDCLLLRKFPRTLNAVLWETHVTKDQRIEVRPSKLETIKQVFAEEIVSIIVGALVGAAAAAEEPSSSNSSSLVQWIKDNRLVAMDAELEGMEASFEELKAKLRFEVCEEAYGEFEAGRAAHILALQAELRAALLKEMDLRDERDEMAYALRALEALAQASAVVVVNNKNKRARRRY